MNAHFSTVSSESRRGFSIAELLVVLVIITILSTAAIFSYRGFRNDGLVKGAADKVSAVMIEARTRAIVDNTPTSFTLDLTNQVMWVDVLDGALAITEPKVTTPEYLGPDVRVDELRVNSDTFTDGIRQVIFRPDGSNQFATLILRRAADDPAVERNITSVQIYPSSAEPRIWANVRR